MLLSFHLDAQQRATNIHVVKSSGYGRLDKAAQSALQQSMFKHPAEIMQKEYRIAFDFQLEDAYR